MHPSLALTAFGFVLNATGFSRVPGHFSSAMEASSSARCDGSATATAHPRQARPVCQFRVRWSCAVCNPLLPKGLSAQRRKARQTPIWFPIRVARSEASRRTQRKNHAICYRVASVIQLLRGTKYS